MLLLLLNLFTVQALLYEIVTNGPQTMVLWESTVGLPPFLDCQPRFPIVPACPSSGIEVSQWSLINGYDYYNNVVVNASGDPTGYNDVYTFCFLEVHQLCYYDVDSAVIVEQASGPWLEGILDQFNYSSSENLTTISVTGDINSREGQITTTLFNEQVPIRPCVPLPYQPRCSNGAVPIAELRNTVVKTKQISDRALNVRAAHRCRYESTLLCAVPGYQKRQLQRNVFQSSNQPILGQVNSPIVSDLPLILTDVSVKPTELPYFTAPKITLIGTLTLDLSLLDYGDTIQLFSGQVETRFASLEIVDPCLEAEFGQQGSILIISTCTSTATTISLYN